MGFSQATALKHIATMRLENSSAVVVPEDSLGAADDSTVIASLAYLPSCPPLPPTIQRVYMNTHQWSVEGHWAWA